MSGVDIYKPRLCHIVRGPSGYGFHLHGEKGKYGQSIRKVEVDSAAEQAGLRAGDRIIAVNGKNVESEPHQQVVARIKEKSGDTTLLVVDEVADKYFRDNNIVVTEDLVINGIPVTTQETCMEPPKTNSSDNFRPRLCHLVRGPQGYGFNLHSEKSKSGRYIRSVDENGASAVAGVKAGDRIIEVNGINMEFDKHTEVVSAIKESGGKVDLLVVDEKTDAFFKSCQVTPSLQHINGPLPTPIQEAVLNPTDEKQPPAPATTPAAENPPQLSSIDLLCMDLTALKEKSRSRKKQAPSDTWNNRHAMFNSL